MNSDDPWPTNTPIDDYDRGQLSYRAAGPNSRRIHRHVPADDQPTSDDRVAIKSDAVANTKCPMSLSKEKCHRLSLERQLASEKDTRFEAANVHQVDVEMQSAILPLGEVSVSSLSSSGTSEQKQKSSRTRNLQVTNSSIDDVPSNVYLSSTTHPSILTPEMKAMYREQVSREIAEFARRKAEEKRQKRLMHVVDRPPAPCFCHRHLSFNRRMTYPGATRPKASYMQHRALDTTTI